MPGRNSDGVRPRRSLHSGSPADSLNDGIWIAQQKKESRPSEMFRQLIGDEEKRR